MSDEMTQKPVTGFGIEPSDMPANTDPRCPTVLLLDVSSSMSGQKIQKLEDAMIQYFRDLESDPLAKRRVEVAIVTFGGVVNVAHAFAEAQDYVTPSLDAEGDTPMGQAIVKGLELLRQRKAELARQGIPQFRAWVFLITDGAPTDDRLPVWKDAVRAIQEGEAKKSFTFFSVAVEDADFEKLQSLGTEKPPMKLRGLSFRELFQWLSNSQKAVSKSSPGEKVNLPPVDWGSI